MDPTVEPDPDNAGGGIKAMHTTPSAEGVFYSFPIFPIGFLTA
jgi:hypothetical protein